MNWWGLFRFFRNRFPAPSAAGLSSSPAPLTPGGYYAATTSATPPDPTNAAAWTPTTKDQDVGLNDHTTFESHAGDAGSCYLHMLNVAAAPYTLGTWTYAANTVGDGSGTTRYWDGAAWQAIGVSPAWNHIVAQWEDISVNTITPQAGVTFSCLTVVDNAVVLPAALIGDSRPGV